MREWAGRSLRSDRVQRPRDQSHVPRWAGAEAGCLHFAVLEQTAGSRSLARGCRKRSTWRGGWRIWRLTASVRGSCRKSRFSLGAARRCWRSTSIRAPSRPNFLSREGAAGGVYVRVGSTNRRADAELIEELRRFARGEGFDEQPLVGLDSEASRLPSRFRVVFRRPQAAPSRSGDAAAGHGLPGAKSADGWRHLPVRPGSGAPLSGRLDPGRPFCGHDRSRIVDRVEIHSLAVSAIGEAIAFVHKHALHGASIVAVRRREHWNLPPEAVREAMINAVARMRHYAQRRAPMRV